MEEQEKHDDVQTRLLILAVQQSSEGIAIVDMDGRVKYLNEAFARMHGYSASELLGKNLSVFHSPEQMPSVEEANRQIKTTGKFRGEIWHLRSDGSVFPGIMHNSLIRDEEGNPGYIIGLLRNITHRKQLEEALEKSQKALKEKNELLDSILTASGVGIGYSRNRKIVWGNEALAQTFGYEKEEDYIGKDTRILYAGEEEYNRIGELIYGITPGKVVETEVKFKRHDNNREFIGHLKVNILDPSDNEKGVIINIIDISEQKRAEEALTESEKQYRLLAENVTDVIAVIDFNNLMFNYLSPSAEAVFGYPLADLMNIKVFDLLTPPSAIYMLAILNREVKKEKLGKAEPQRLEVEVQLKNGSTAWMEVSTRFLRDDKKQITGILCVIRDISKRIEAEEALKKSEDRYRHLVEKMSDGLVVRDENGRLSFVNNKFCEMLGYRQNQMIGKSVMDLMDDRNRQIVENQISQREKGRPVEPYELELLRKNGSKISVYVSPQDIRDSAGKSKGSFAVVTDITLYKQAEYILHQAKNELEEKVKQRTAELEERNTALKVLLNQRDQDRTKLEEIILSNINALIKPNLTRLKNSGLTGKQKVAVNVLESNLNEIVFPFMDRRSLDYMKLTPTEIQVTNFLKNGSTTKEIAKSLGLSQRTIDTHRYNIRKKIGIKGKGINLRTYLSSL